ncbi:MAG: hypothetical protein FRX49_05126 [Trebouxia sp. A1-2]|nr:MAG: hypothetical protein FRX49_05126 [Trebouxia sp. A1-2]
MSQIKPASGPTFVGKTQGNTPNLFWRRISFDQLRFQSQYVGLPPPDQLHLESTADYRNVRQESQLWTELHQGLLTTGRLNAALGFYEPAAAKRLGIPRDRVNHNSLLSAAANLQMPAYGLECLDHPAAPVTSVQATAAASVVPPGLQNAITVSEFEAAAIKLANASLAGAPGSTSKQRQRRPHKPQQQQQPSANAAVASNAAVKAPTSLLAESGLDPYATAEARRKRCTGVATRGEGGIRMAWGSTQEASALFSVMHLFPDSQLEEVGLCWVDPTSQIPAEWGFQAGDLPPLGASPDGIIRHSATAPPPPPMALHKPHQSLLQSQTANQAPSPAVGSAAQLDPPQISPTSQATWGSASHTSIAQASSTEPAQKQDNGTVLSEFETLLAKLQISSNHLSSKHTHTKPYSTATVESADRLAAALPNMAPSASATIAASCTASSGSAFNNAANATPSQSEEHQQEWLEAVEIKNVCPFREVREVANNGKAKRLYRLSDSGPYSRVPCHFVPQLQMEMLASGANSALVVSRSATQGVRVFRMQRHAVFLQQMLHTISQLYTRYIRCNRLPPPNIFFEQASYQQFLRTTQSVAESVELVVDVDSQALPHVQDCRLFL